MISPRALHHEECEEAQLVAALEKIFCQKWQKDVRVVSATATPSPFASRFPAEVVSLTLSDGGSLRLFRKRFGNEELDHPDKQVRDREGRIYNELLNSTELPVAEFYGTHWSAETGRNELYLEYVDDWDLRYQDLSAWRLAAASLGDLHRHFASRSGRLFETDYLLRFNVSHLVGWAWRALEGVRRHRRLARRLELVVDRYEPVAKLLECQPPTLVHNDLSAKNVILDRNATPARVCLVDWEMAGIGCGLLDLVHLVHGLDEAEERRMCEAYTRSLDGTGLVPTGQNELRRLMSACAMHTTHVLLWRNSVWNLPEARLEKWVFEQETRIRAISGSVARW